MRVAEVGGMEANLLASAEKSGFNLLRSDWISRKCSTGHSRVGLRFDLNERLCIRNGHLIDHELK
jgi:hypothetical protein